MNLKPYTAELGAALAFVIYWLASSFVPALEPMQGAFIAILVIVFGFLFGTQVKKGLIGAARTAVLAVPDYLAEIVTAVIGVVASLIVGWVPDLAPYQAELASIIVAIVFAVLNFLIGLRKGLAARA